LDSEWLRESLLICSFTGALALGKQNHLSRGTKNRINFSLDPSGAARSQTDIVACERLAVRTRGFLALVHLRFVVVESTGVACLVWSGVV